MHTTHSSTAWRIGAVAGSCLVALALVTGNAAAQGTEAYKWRDENGNWHYGDHYPPEYSDDERKKLNEYGVVTDDLPAEPTPEELARMELEARIQAEIAAEKARQQEYLTNLFRSYATEKDLDNFYKSQLDAIYLKIAANDRKLRELRSQLIDLEEQAAGYNWPYRADSDLPEMPDELVRDLVDTTQRIAEREADASTNRRKLRERQASYEDDLRMYRAHKRDKRGLNIESSPTAQARAEQPPPR
jgi:Holliday junction resolvase RusA-like endonuclease